jgi:MFS family permease
MHGESSLTAVQMTVMLTNEQGLARGLYDRSRQLNSLASDPGWIGHEGYLAGSRHCWHPWCDHRWCAQATDCEDAYVLGIILMATFDGTAGYSAGYTLYWIGYDAIYLICDIFIADTSGLRNRAFGFAFINTPFIITAFVGPYAAQSFITNAGWRWAVGAFAIIQVVVIAPLGILFKFYEKKAKKMGLFESRVSGRSTLQSIAHYFHEFDVVGAILIMAAFVLFLLPFSLQTSARVTYGSSAFIAMIVVGLLLFPIFAVWEKFFARTHFIRWELFRQRTIVGAVMVAIAIQFSFYCWELYFNQFLQIVYGLSISNAGYMLQIYNVGSCFWGVVFGLWVRYSRHVKYESLCFGLPLAFLGAGLTIYFRGQDGGNDVGFIVMTQIFIAFGGGTLVIAHQVATMAACDREGVPMALALLGMFSRQLAQLSSPPFTPKSIPRLLPLNSLLVARLLSVSSISVAP